MGVCDGGGAGRSSLWLSSGLRGSTAGVPGAFLHPDTSQILNGTF